MYSYKNGRENDDNSIDSEVSSSDDSFSRAEDVNSYKKYISCSPRSKSKSKSESSHKSGSYRSKSKEAKKSKTSEKSEKFSDRKKRKSKKDRKKGSKRKRSLSKGSAGNASQDQTTEMPNGYASDDFLEMLPPHRKKNKNMYGEVDKGSTTQNNDVDPLDAYMMELSASFYSNNTPAKGKSNNTLGGPEYTEDKDYADAGPELTAAEPDTLESLTQAYLEEKRQKLPDIDHERTYYKKCNFNLYKEVPEISNMSNRQMKALRNIKEIVIKGKDCPRLITKWSHAIVQSKLLKALHYNKMNEPTPIQCQVIPAIMSGRDVIGVAKTGSGKTLAYLLPLFRHILNQDSVLVGEGPIVLVMCPTRELCIQIYQEVQKITVFLKSVRCGCIFGGADAAQQIAKVKKGVEILVATPGRMIDIMTTNSGRNLSLSRCTFIVLDEADRMFDMGFEPQVLAILKRVRPDRQTVMFSATFPRKIEAIAKKITKDPLEIRAGGGNKVCNDVTQHVMLLDEENKFMQLMDIISKFEDHGKILVFVEKQETASIISDNLNHQNYRNTPLYGGLSQEKREEAIFNFRHNNIWILIATSVAARGLDVTDLICVVNYDCPNHYEDYVHRCGRTGRAGHKGDAFTFVTPDQEIMFGWLIKALKDNGQASPQNLLEANHRYVERMRAQGKEIKAPSGFRGHGFKFDAAEAMQEKEKRLQQLQHYCPEDITEEDEAILREMDGGATTSTAASNETFPCSVYEQQSHARTAHQIAARLNQKLDACVEPNSALDFYGAGGSNISSTTSSIVGEVVRKEIDINRYPAHIRYLLTTKELRNSLSENYNVTSLVKGEYMGPREAKRAMLNPSLGGGSRPLHLLLEAETHVALNAAENEIIRVVKEGLNKK